MGNIDPSKFSQLVPSSRASQKPPKAKAKPYTISVQRRDKGGRFREIASWIVTTDEEDMAGPLGMGLRDNYRIVVREGKTDDSGRTDNGGGPEGSPPKQSVSTT